MTGFIFTVMLIAFAAGGYQLGKFVQREETDERLAKRRREGYCPWCGKTL